jgi:transcriptional regulator with XRE-family HTH domain
MTTGEYIRKLRTGDNKYGRKWSQEELGRMLKPSVNRAAVNKWETGLVENIKKPYIEQLASIFGIEPGDLMCFESKYNEEKISEEVATIESVQKLFGREAVQLLQYFNELNDSGKQKALNDIGDLTEITKYTL